MCAHIRSVVWILSAALVSLLCLSLVQAADPVATGPTRTSTNATLALTIVASDMELSAGRWAIASVAPATVITQAVLVPQVVPDVIAGARRVQTSEIERRVESGRWRVQGIFSPLRDYAASHGGVGPQSFKDLDEKRWSGLLQMFDRSPWPDEPNVPATGPYYFLIPGAQIQTGTTPRAPAGPPPTPVVVELYPYVDDGKHWVLLSNGTVERRAIDPDLRSKDNLTIRPVRPKVIAAEKPATPVSVRHMLFARLQAANAAAVTLTLNDAATGKRLDVRWNLADAQPGSASLVGEWAQARAREWQPLAVQGDSAILRAWIERTRDLYGGAPPAPPDPRAQREPPRTTDAFGILGGRAAMRETLQMELLRAGRGGDRPLSETPTIPVSSLKGVEVTSLPFVETLAGARGGQLALADRVPIDRLFVYFAKPAALFPFLDSGSDFLFRAGSLFTKSAIDDDLKGRYLRRLGLTEHLGRRFLESGEVTELALTAPDLFFLDGTDLTLLMRLKSPDRIFPRLKDFGFPDLRADGIVEKSLPSGRSAYWARQGDLLALSTSRAELSSIVTLGPGQSGTRLGRAAEFRYMLTQLPLKKDTRAFLYLSDPFIRRMVGPAVKIAQLRRMRARADMEIITAGALLYRLDGHRDTPDLDALVRLGYVPRALAARGYRVRDDLSVVSPVWGTAADMTAIDAAAIDKITAPEAQAYQTYVDEYARYWRQYFDPIAMRLDDAAGGALELSTFILPLLDSQLYAQLREFLAVREGGGVLRVPVVTPEPVLMFSQNLTNSSWIKLSGSWSQVFSQYTGIDPAIFDRLGPGFHIAIQDADPIIALGNADVLGSFGGLVMTSGQREGFTIPFLLSILTRPCKIFLELQDPQAALDILRRAGGGTYERTMPGVGAEFRQVEGQDAWIYALNVPGIAKIRFGIEVKNNYLVLSNIPWSQPVSVKTIEQRELNGAALELAPGAVKLGLPGLFATQSEQNQLAALRSMAALYPLLLTLDPTPDAAAARHAALFGSKPLHPGAGTWLWKDGRIESSAYGTPMHWKEPLYRPEMGDFGLFEGVTRVGVNMQFEQSGLRAVVRWFWKGK